MFLSIRKELRETKTVSSNQNVFKIIKKTQQWEQITFQIYYSLKHYSRHMAFEKSVSNCNMMCYDTTYSVHIMLAFTAQAQFLLN